MKLISSYQTSQGIIADSNALLRYRESFLSDPLRFVELNLRQNAFRRVLNYLILAHHTLRVEISITEQRMADDLGICVRWVKEAIRKLKELGLISFITHYGKPLFKGRKMRRGSDGKYRRIWIRVRRNVYTISYHLFEPSIGSKLCSLFSGLSEKVRSLPKYIATSLLFVNSLYSYPKKECQMEYCTTNNISVYTGNHSLSRSIYQSREVNIVTEDTYMREVNMDPELLSQKISQLRSSLEPQRAAQRETKAEAAREMSELLRGRVTAAIHLTAKGQLHMMRYCDGALLYGLENLTHHGTIDSRTNYSLFEAACIEYSRKNEIEIDVHKYDNLIRSLGYVDSQQYCKKIILEEPLCHYKKAPRVSEKSLPPKPYIPPRHSEKKMYAALDPALKDPIIALALRLGYEDRLNLPQISNEKLDLTE
jgi:hypothetical protein